MHGLFGDRRNSDIDLDKDFGIFQLEASRRMGLRLIVCIEPTFFHFGFVTSLWCLSSPGCLSISPRCGVWFSWPMRHGMLGESCVLAG